MAPAARAGVSGQLAFRSSPAGVSSAVARPAAEDPAEEHATAKYNHRATIAFRLELRDHEAGGFGASAAGRRPARPLMAWRRNSERVNITRPTADTITGKYYFDYSSRINYN